MVYRNELIRRLSRDTRLSQEVVTDVLNAFERELKQGLAAGDSFQLTGFGTFYTRKTPAGEGLNFQTMEKMSYGASRMVAFKAGELLRKAVKPKRKSS